MLQIVVNKSNLILSINLKSKSNHTDMGRSSKVPYTKDDLLNVFNSLYLRELMKLQL